VAAGGETRAQARELCLQGFERCADACEAALATLEPQGEGDEVRSDLIVCAAVCRVGHHALGDGLAVADTLVQYAVEVCRRCTERLVDVGDGRLEDAGVACAAAAESATTLLLVS
jgi:hypothetical protein